MIGAARLGWVDGIMMTYNYRLMHTAEMKQAVADCERAGIGLTAMKTQGGGAVSTTTETEVELAGRFMARGFSSQQAKLKAVWDSPQIASICSQMPNLTILMANISAALDKTRLAADDRRLLDRHARNTAAHYCAGCGHICEAATGGDMPVADIMRYLMYHRSYGESERARRRFKTLPDAVRKQILTIDYRKAEQLCPQKMAIGRLMHDASVELV